MFEFNSRTIVNKEFKVKEILKLINASKIIKDDTQLIKSLKLKNVLSKDTMNMKSSEDIKEIYIFEIEVLEKNIPIDFIKAFDKIIELHTFFYIKYRTESLEVVIYREVVDGTIKRLDLYKSFWQCENFIELPYCTSIEDIYKNLIFNLIGLEPITQEKINCYLQRFNKIQKLKKEIDTLDKKAFRENQPRKKFEISKISRTKKEELRELYG